MICADCRLAATVAMDAAHCSCAAVVIGQSVWPPQSASARKDSSRCGGDAGLEGYPGGMGGHFLVIQDGGACGE
jgi:hypothetical protein